MKEVMNHSSVLLKAIPDLIFRIHKDGTILSCKKDKGLGRELSSRKIIGMKVSKLPDLYPFLSRSLIRQGMKSGIHALRTGRPQVFEHPITVRNKTFYYKILLIANGRDEVLSIMRDLTDIHRLQDQVVEVSEREQRRIGADLHDSLSQHLTGIAYLGKILDQRLTAKSMKEADDISEIVSLINDAIDQTKALARGLHPVDMGGMGLMNAISEFARSMTKLFRVSCDFRYDSPVILHDNGHATHLYRIAQEAVSNAIKHGRATDIVISLAKNNGIISLTIKDNGIGLRRARKNIAGMGVSIMRYRARMIGAAIDIQTGKQGTIVSCTFNARELMTKKGER